MEWILSVAALVLSLAALLHGMYSGPRLVAIASETRAHRGGLYVSVGAELVVYNVGRTGLPIETVGAGPGRDQALQMVRPRTLLGRGVEVNRQLPITIEPGGVMIFFLVDELKVGEFVKIVYLKRNMFFRPVRKVWVQAVEEGMIPGHEKDTF